MNILVTGSNGQLGNEMVRVSGKSKERYVFTDIAELDITKLDAVLSLVRKEQIDVIVNCAAYTNVDKAEDDEKTADLINHVAVGYLAAAVVMKNERKKKLGSSHCVGEQFLGNTRLCLRE